MLSLPNRRARYRNDACRDARATAVALLVAVALGACSPGSTVNLGAEAPRPSWP